MAHRYNFKNKKITKIIISLDSSLTKLVCVDAKNQGSWNLFGNSTSYKLSSFKKIIYGGTTDNFKKHRRILRRSQTFEETK